MSKQGTARKVVQKRLGGGGNVGKEHEGQREGAKKEKDSELTNTVKLQFRAGVRLSMGQALPCPPGTAVSDMCLRGG